MVAQFSNSRRGAYARDELARGVKSDSMTLTEPSMAQETGGEARAMGKIVLIIALASVLGTAFGVALGAVLAFTVGPPGTSGYIIQIVSWAIFMHVLIGMWAGYLLLADRSGREIRSSGPVTLTVRCANIDATALAERLRTLGATSVEIRDGAAFPAPG